VWKTPITPGTAAIMTDLMVGVALRGTASCCIALAGGIPVAAKTGTAQLNAAGEPQASHLWITAFAPADAPKYAVVVMLKGTNEEISAGTGGRVAGPIAKAMLDAMFAADAAAAAPPAEPPVEPATEPTTEPAPAPTTGDGANG
jgi:peptidoglycan glycosyltransferase